MAITIMVHLIGEEAVMCETNQLPGPADSSLLVTNLRKRDGKDVSFLELNVKSVLFPLARINFIEVLQSGEEDEEIIGFARD
jgi:hypothetical protein